MLGFDLQHGSAQGVGGAGATEITAWIVIGPDVQVTIRIAKSEMGQGVFTGLAMAIAEMNDGTYWSDEVDVIVTIAACLEDPV